MQRDGVPPSFAGATWRCTLPANRDGVIGLGFNVGTEVLRLALPRADAQMLLASLSDALATGRQAVELVPSLPGLD